MPGNPGKPGVPGDPGMTGERGFNGRDGGQGIEGPKGQKGRVIHYNDTTVPLPHIFTVTLQPIATILPQHCYCVPKDYCYYCKHALSETSCNL